MRRSMTLPDAAGREITGKDKARQCTLRFADTFVDAFWAGKETQHDGFDGLKKWVTRSWGIA